MNPKKRSARQRLATIEDDLSDIERLTKELRKRLAEVAETVRVAAEEIIRGSR